jgi:hypothetical protein
MSKNLKKVALLSIFFSIFFVTSFAQSQLSWPKITQQNKPWARWWWEGSAVDTTNLKWMLQEYHKVGLGGLEITPIYGVKGAENKFVNFLSPKWMDMLTYTLSEAKKVDIGIDMAQASGWPFGGPWVKDEDASKYFSFQRYSLNQGEKLQAPVLFQQKTILRTVGEKIAIDKLVEPIAANPNMQLHAFDQVRYPKMLKAQTLMAYSDQGSILNLTDKLGEDGTLNWVAPKGKWTLYALFEGMHGKMVERAGPGGEGYAIDHFSLPATNNYLNFFDKAFKGYDLSYLRAFFNDSYEVDDAQGEANWTTNFINEFKTRRGYDLRNEIPALFGFSKNQDSSSRVLTDYRQTISDLLLENYTQAWHKWSNGKGKLIRNQAHGSPANILDLYAATDIPEAEGDDVLRIKFASSAAHVTGKPLSSSESATWENDHFLSKLGDVKKKMDLFLLGGINHTFYHGANFTPKDAKWPGWLFYAAVHFTPNNPFWTDFQSLNNYVAHAQSFLQAGKPDNDILLYLPIADSYAKRGNTLLVHYDGIEKGFAGSGLDKTANALYDAGFAFDFISDAQLLKTTTSNGKIKTADLSYQTILVPQANLMPLATLEKLLKLAEQGATITFMSALPKDVPGLANLSQNQDAFKTLLAQLNFVNEANCKVAKIGNGSILLANDLIALMSAAKVSAESMKLKGLNNIRRSVNGGKYYFIVNEGTEAIDAWVPINTKAKSVALFNPMTEQKGFAAIRQTANGTEVFLQLEKQESCILQTFDSQENATDYAYTKLNGQPTLMNQNWKVTFLSGGPVLPKELRMETLKSWTSFGADYENFSGTAAYSQSFKKPKGKAMSYLLDLGKVEESVKVILNGQEIATLIGPDYKLKIPADQFKKLNKLELLVTNGMANRAAWMDKTKQNYKIFYNINMSARLAENRGEDGLFTAKKWTVKPSGLLGSVSLTPLTSFKPE